MSRRLTADQARRLAAAVLVIRVDASLEAGREAYVRQLASVVSAADLCRDTLASVQFAWAVWQALDSLVEHAEIILADDLVVVLPDHHAPAATYGPTSGHAVGEHLRGQRVDTVA